MMGRSSTSEAELSDTALEPPSCILLSGSHHQMMASAQVVETLVNTNNSPSQDYTTNPDDHSNHNSLCSAVTTPKPVLM